MKGNEMSTFDTLCDWQDGLISDEQAIVEVLCYMARNQPEMPLEETFQALLEILGSMIREKSEEGYKNFLAFREKVIDNL